MPDPIRIAVNLDEIGFAAIKQGRIRDCVDCGKLTRGRIPTDGGQAPICIACAAVRILKLKTEPTASGGAQ